MENYQCWTISIHTNRSVNKSKQETKMACIYLILDKTMKRINQDCKHDIIFVILVKIITHTQGPTSNIQVASTSDLNNQKKLLSHSFKVFIKQNTKNYLFKRWKTKIWIFARKFSASKNIKVFLVWYSSTRKQRNMYNMKNVI